MINGYEIKRMDTMAFEKLISAVTMWQKVIDGSSKYTTAHVTRKTAEAISYVTGVRLPTFSEMWKVQAKLFLKYLEMALQQSSRQRR